MNTKSLSTDLSILDYLKEKIMEMPTTQNTVERKYSQQMQAVLMILNADSHLLKAVSPFINFQNESIYWDKILALPLGSGHRGAIRWAYGIWTDEMPKGNCFDGALNMSPFLKVAVLEALCLRWGLRG